MTGVVIPPIGDLPVLLADGLPFLLTGTGLDVVEAKPTYLRLKRDAALIGLTLRTSHPRGIEERRGYVRTFTSPTHAAVLHRKHGGTNVLRLRGGRSVLFLYPADAGLPGLHRVADPAGLKRSLAALSWVGGEGWRIRDRRSDVAVVSYRPERRLVARVCLKLRRESERLRRDVFVRYYPEGRGETVAANLSAVHSVVPSPEPLGTVLDGRLTVETALDGAPLAERAESADPVELAALLTTLHQAPPPPGSGRTLAAVALAATRAVEHLRAVLPATTSDGRYVELSLARPPAPSTAPRLVHGDLHSEQIQLTSHGPALLDVDRLGAGDPMVDLGTLAADLRVRGHHRLAEHVVNAYLDAAPPCHPVPSPLPSAAASSSARCSPSAPCNPGGPKPCPPSSPRQLQCSPRGRRWASDDPRRTQTIAPAV